MRIAKKLPASVTIAATTAFSCIVLGASAPAAHADGGYNCWQDWHNRLGSHSGARDYCNVWGNIDIIHRPWIHCNDRYGSRPGNWVSNNNYSDVYCSLWPASADSKWNEVLNVNGPCVVNAQSMPAWVAATGYRPDGC